MLEIAYKEELAFLRGFLPLDRFCELQEQPYFISILKDMKKRREGIENSPPNPFLLSAARCQGERYDNMVLKCLKQSY